MQPSPAQQVVVLTGRTPLVLQAAAGAGLQLSTEERERMSRLRRPEDRDDFLAGHLLVRLCAGRLLGVAPGDVSILQRCSRCGGPHGRPLIVGRPDVGASLAHSRGVVAAAAGTVPVGVDVEVVPTTSEVAGGDMSPGDLSLALTEAELAAVDGAADPRRALHLLWVRKEACVKAGLVDLDGLDHFDLSALPLDPAAGALAPRPASIGPWDVHDWWDAVGAVGAAVCPAGTSLTLFRVDEEE